MQCIVLNNQSPDTKIVSVTQHMGVICRCYVKCYLGMIQIIQSMIFPREKILMKIFPQTFFLTILFSPKAPPSRDDDDDVTKIQRKAFSDPFFLTFFSPTKFFHFFFIFLKTFSDDDDVTKIQQKAFPTIFSFFFSTKFFQFFPPNFPPNY